MNLIQRTTETTKEIAIGVYHLGSSITSGLVHGVQMLFQAAVILSLFLFLSSLLLWISVEFQFSYHQFLPEHAVDQLTRYLLPINSALGFTFLLSFYLSRKNLRKKGSLEQSLRESREQLSRRNKELRSSIEFLTAAREVALILNENVDFETILRKVLRITADLLGSGNTREITIFTAGGEGRPEPRASWKNGELLFGDRAQKEINPGEYVQKVFDYGQQMTLAGDDFQFILPLTADREKTGVLRVAMAFDNQKENQLDLYRRLSNDMNEFAKIIALAMKTPDLYTRTIKDGLTGLFSKKHLLNQLETHVSMTRRHEEDLSIVFIDLDHFKELNDEHGHQTGDRVLKTIGTFLQKNTRKYTTAYRYGGEEMVLLCPRTGRKEASTLADRLRKGIEDLDVESTEGEPLQITASFGVSSTEGNENETLSGTELLERADQALYVSKENGRNQVHAWEDTREMTHAH